MPLIKSKSQKAFESNMQAEMETGKPKDQSLAIAYSVQRKASKKRKMAEGGIVKDEQASSESRPMPSQTARDASMVSRNSSKHALKDSTWTDNPTVAQARKPSRTLLSEPRMTESSVIRARPLGMLKDQERDLMRSAAPGSPSDQPKKEYDEEGADRQGPAVPDMQKQHNNDRKAYFEGGAVTQEESEEDNVEHPAGLESDDDQMRPDGYMKDRDPAAYAEGGIVHEMDMQPEPEASEEKHASLAAAIMAKRKKYAMGGQVDIDENAEEMPNEYYHRNQAVLKENYDSDLDDVSQPMDSNLMGDEREEMTSDRHDMVGKIRNRMKSRMR